MVIDISIQPAKQDSSQISTPFSCAIRELLNFNFEGTAYQAHTNEADGTEALYRFYNTENGTHFYTTSEAERDAVIENLPNFNYEGIAYYVDGLA